MCATLNVCLWGPYCKERGKGSHTSCNIHIVHRVFAYSGVVHAEALMWPIAACSKSRSIIALRGAGQFIGEVLLFDNTGRDAPMGSWQTCVRARTDVQALILTVKDLKELVTRKPAAEVELRAGQLAHSHS